MTITYNGITYHVIDQTLTHYICSPLNNNEGYSWITKELINQ